MAREKISWIGNKNKLELHRVVNAGFNQPQGCQFSEIADDRKIKFRTAREALQGKPKYDACAYCSVKFRSRR